jgi:radical SAM protein with 4Fe4S-binding SPASM domain
MPTASTSICGCCGKIRKGRGKRFSANGSNRSGSAIACVGWDGTVHPDQFWRVQVLGNIRDRLFSSIWSDSSLGLLSRLRDREGRIGGRCGNCRHFGLCRGNLRARAEALTGDPWASDPGCYLTDCEVLPMAVNQ